MPRGSSREVERAKLKYRKLYKQAKQREYAQSRKRVELTYSLNEYEQFEREARKARMNVPSYLRKAINASRKNQAFLPNDSTLHDLQMEIRRIGNNINQLTYLSQRNKHVSPETIASARVQLNQIEDQIKQAFLLPRS